MSSSPSSYAYRSGDPPPGWSCASYAEGPGVARVTLSGELDIATAPQLRDALAEAARRSVLVILDLSELTFMDSTGLQGILAAHARLAEADRRLVIVPGGRQVQRIFKITGMENRLEFIGAASPATSGRSGHGEHDELGHARPRWGSSG